MLLPSVVWSESWQLTRDGSPVGTVQTRSVGGDTFVMIAEMGRLFGYSAKSLNDGLLINKANVNLQVIPNAAAVWIGYEIVSLRKQAFVSDGRWWMDSDSALLVMEKLLAKSGEGGKLLWRGSGSPSPSDPLQKPAEVPAPSTAPVTVPVPPTVKADTVESASFRWGIHEDRVRLVVEASEKVSFSSFPQGVRFAFKGKPDIGPSPDPAISTEVKKEGDSWVLSVSAPGWKYGLFELTDPHRAVADFLRPSTAPAAVSLPPAAPPTQSVQPKPRPAPGAKKRPLVVVDPGHGGKDPGAVAHGYREKDLALQISKRLVKNIQALGMDAKLTRDDDRYLLLRNRTELANKWDADAFVSIHLNALPKGRHAKGVEIYLMALPTDKDAMELAKIENAELLEGGNGQGGGDKTSLLLSILGDMQQNNKIQESTNFAEALFSAGQSGKLPMRRVAQAPFYVLRGAAMPAVLVETGFISELSEAKMLADPAYQERLAKSLAQGIKAYLK